MHHDIFLIDSIKTTKFMTNIYSVDKDLNISIKPSDIEHCESPRQICDIILSINGVNLIEILDDNNHILLVSSNILPENIDNYE